MLHGNLTVLSHWSTLVEGMKASPLEFYKQVEEAVKKREIPDLRLDRVTWKESGILSADREYLRVARGRYLYDICAAPFGNGFFFSSWMAEKLPSPFWAIISSLFLLLFVAPFSFLLFVRYAGILGILLWCCALVAGLVFLVVSLSKQESAFADHVFVIPFIGPILERLCRPNTYFRIDTETMFRTTAHNAVLEAVDAATKESGIREIAGDERKPILREFFQR